MIIQHNMTAANTNRMLGITNGNIAKTTEKLSSGYKINRAGDNAAGLSISEKMRSQIRGLDQASVNAQDGISLIQTAEGALNETHAMLQRMRELCVQGANDTNVTADREAITAEITELNKEITRIANTTEFNTMKLLNGDFNGKKFMIGANNGQSEEVTDIDSMDADTLGLTDLASAADQADFEGGVATVDTAIATVSSTRSNLGAWQNRLEHTIANVDNTSENLQAAESRIRDVDMADEMVKYSKDNILQQAGQSMLAQANQASQGILALIR